MQRNSQRPAAPVVQERQGPRRVGQSPFHLGESRIARWRPPLSATHRPQPATLLRAGWPAGSTHPGPPRSRPPANTLRAPGAPLAANSPLAPRFRLAAPAACTRGRATISARLVVRALVTSAAIAAAPAGRPLLARAVSGGHAARHARARASGVGPASIITAAGTPKRCPCSESSKPCAVTGPLSPRCNVCVSVGVYLIVASRVAGAVLEGIRVCFTDILARMKKQLQTAGIPICFIVPSCHGLLQRICDNFFRDHVT